MTYLYFWNKVCGGRNRKGQPCQVTARGKMNSIRVEFEDGFVVITSGNSIRKSPAGTNTTQPRDVPPQNTPPNGT